ncbi:polyprenyl synthetase family protein [Thermotoga profunda]|uniref:polyprenyl synthetase family protein n=1 Tax=Thermotoga profunda TaxID=1508420 RepID=UPI000693CAD0|nr:polyprenyl synthetase family protein [Thermotoga profunda]
MKNEDFLEVFNKKLQNLIPKSSKVEEAMNYSLLSGGKRIRPILIKTICEDMMVDIDLVWHPALAIELFHTGSLIHDDLPQIDDSPLRRGRPSCHVVYGNDFAILAGDGLMLKSFCVLSQSPANENVKAVLFREFSRSTYDVLIGEALDVEYTGKRQELDKVIKMYAKKTGGLFSFCVASGAMLSEKFHLIDKLSKLGSLLGVWFQVVDDLKDALSDETAVGKTVGRDKILGKPTVVSIVGIQKAENFADKLLKGVVKRFSELGMNGTVDFLKSLAK